MSIIRYNAAPQDKEVFSMADTHTISIGIEHLAAWSPGLPTTEDWVQWAETGHITNEEEKPKVKAIPAMTRRRLTQWGRIALEVASQCIDKIDENTPTIFASRHGDTQRTYKLLQDIANDEPLSPTAFSLSVHNSSSGIFSIVNNNIAGALAIASGKETLANAFIEAAGLLRSGNSKVLLVFCDEPLAEFYRQDADEQELTHALAMVLTASSENKDPQLTLTFSSAEKKNEMPNNSSSDKAAPSLSQQFLALWYGNSASLDYPGNRLNWHFEVQK